MRFGNVYFEVSPEYHFAPKHQEAMRSLDAARKKEYKRALGLRRKAFLDEAKAKGLATEFFFKEQAEQAMEKLLPLAQKHGLELSVNEASNVYL